MITNKYIGLIHNDVLLYYRYRVVYLLLLPNQNKMLFSRIFRRHGIWSLARSSSCSNCAVYRRVLMRAEQFYYAGSIYTGMYTGQVFVAGQSEKEWV